MSKGAVKNNGEGEIPKAFGTFSVDKGGKRVAEEIATLPELLIPAGDLDKLKFAFEYGADAVYMGIPSFSMRSRQNNFDEKSFLEGVKYVRSLRIRRPGEKVARKAKLYATVNIYPRNNKIEAFKKHLKFLKEKVKPDALIIADPGVIEVAKEVYPRAVLHLSVQANTLNYKSVEFWKKQGVTRVILPRELMLEEIAEIHRRVPDMELEVFVHGAICVAYSGRCLLSAYMTGRDANQGICAHSCRWKYKVYAGNSGREGQMLSRDSSELQVGKNLSRDTTEFFLEEEVRKGEFLPIEEHDEGTYIMNSRDNCAIEYLKELRDAGVCSFKIEGRNKTVYYLAVVARAYRKAIDDMVAGRKFDRKLLNELNKISNRGYIPGFLKGFPGKDNVKFDGNRSSDSDFKFIGIIREAKCFGEDDLYKLEARNRFEVGDEVEVIMPEGVGSDLKIGTGCGNTAKVGTGIGSNAVVGAMTSAGANFSVKVKEILNLSKEKVKVAHGGDKDVYVRLERGIPEMAILRKRD